MERILKLDGITDVIVEISQPEVDKETDGHYKCRYTIHGLPKVLNGEAMGVDAIQAIHFALKLVGNRLYTLDEFRENRLTWPFSVDSQDLGFPTAVTATE